MYIYYSVAVDRNENKYFYPQKYQRDKNNMCRNLKIFLSVSVIMWYMLHSWILYYANELPD